MSEIIQWPVCVLTPQQASADLVPFSRSGGRTLGGIEPSTRTDLGFWSVTYSGIVMQNRERRAWQTWNAIRQTLGGRPGMIAVRVRSSLSAPYVSGKFEPVIETDHSDDSPFDDDTPYTQGAISVVTDGVTAVGATSIRLRIINADANLVGVRFSYNHALYETGPVTSKAAIFGPCRFRLRCASLFLPAQISSSTSDVPLPPGRGPRHGHRPERRRQVFAAVRLVFEAVDYWSNL